MNSKLVLIACLLVLVVASSLGEKNKEKRKNAVKNENFNLKWKRQQSKNVMRCVEMEEVLMDVVARLATNQADIVNLDRLIVEELLGSNTYMEMRI